MATRTSDTTAETTAPRCLACHQPAMLRIGNVWACAEHVDRFERYSQWASELKDRHARAAATRALAKSSEQADIGNYPRLIGRDVGPAGEMTSWSVASRTTGGTIYLVDEHIDRATGERTFACDCPAVHCWHRMHAQRGSDGEIPIVGVRRWD